MGIFHGYICVLNVLCSVCSLLSSRDIAYVNTLDRAMISPALNELPRGLLLLLGVCSVLFVIDLFGTNGLDAHPIQAALSLRPLQYMDGWRVVTAPVAPPRTVLAFVASLYLAPTVLAQCSPGLLVARALAINIVTLGVFCAWFFSTRPVITWPLEPWCGLLPVILASTGHVESQTGATPIHLPLLPFSVSAGREEALGWLVVFVAIGGGDADLFVALALREAELAYRKSASASSSGVV